MSQRLTEEPKKDEWKNEVFSDSYGLIRIEPLSLSYSKRLEFDIFPPRNPENENKNMATFFEKKKNQKLNVSKNPKKDLLKIYN